MSVSQQQRQYEIRSAIIQPNWPISSVFLYFCISVFLCFCVSTAGTVGDNKIQRQTTRLAHFFCISFSLYFFTSVLQNFCIYVSLYVNSWGSKRSDIRIGPSILLFLVAHILLVVIVVAVVVVTSAVVVIVVSPIV